MRKTAFILFLLISAGLPAQNRDDCIKKFFAESDDFLKYYTICDTLQLKNKTDRLFIREMIKVFSSREIVASVNALKADSILTQFHARYVRTEATDGINIKDYVRTAETASSKSNFFKHTQLLDTFADSLISHTGILHLSIFYFNPSLESEVYLYEHGARMAGISEFQLNPIYNSPLMSPVFPYEKMTPKTPYHIGIEERNYTRMMVIPIILQGEVMFNVQLIICKQSTPTRKNLLHIK